jgi:hypothetical protein
MTSLVDIHGVFWLNLLPLPRRRRCVMAALAVRVRRRPAFDLGAVAQKSFTRIEVVTSGKCG